jgi:hypothetical protein
MGHPVFCLGPEQPLVLRNKYRDPSLGVARLRARLRCLRMTISKRRLCRSLDSVTRNDFLGEDSGVYIWGKENCTPGISGSQGDLEGLGAPRLPAFKACARRRSAKAFCRYRALIGKGLLPIFIVSALPGWRPKSKEGTRTRVQKHCPLPLPVDHRSRDCCEKL